MSCFDLLYLAAHSLSRSKAIAFPAGNAMDYVKGDMGLSLGTSRCDCAGFVDLPKMGCDLSSHLVRKQYLVLETLQPRPILPLSFACSNTSFRDETSLLYSVNFGPENSVPRTLLRASDNKLF